MPYSLPAQGRPAHRRSFSNILPPPSLASTSSGAFASLGALPTRRRSTRPTFQLGRDDDDDSPDESPEDPRPTKLTINTNLNDDDDDHLHLPPLRLKSKLPSSFDDQPVPFPRSSPLPSPTISEKRPPHPRPSVSRTSSTPILLANGKPLKSSLKSSSSSPNIPFPPQSLVPSILFPQLHEQRLPTHHQRACSAPATPNQISPTASYASISPPPSPPPQKNVHFPSQEEGGLTTVRVYNRSAKPASLLRKGDETETETEGESSSAPNAFNLPILWGTTWNQTGNARAPAYPFPRFGPIPKKPSPLVNLNHDSNEESTFEIDMKNSSPIPARGAERAEGNVFFESLGFICEAGSDKLAKPLTLTGTILVRNIAYHKSVIVRYTLDDWNTTNDVLARHEKSLSALPERFLLASLPLEAEGCPEGERRREVVCKPRGFDDVLIQVGGVLVWDRFRFEISLEKYESSIQQRTMWFVGRYSTAPPVDGGHPVTPIGGDEWWDNNSGNNYRVAFLTKLIEKEEESERKQSDGVNHAAAYRRNVVFSAPPVFTPSKQFPAPPQLSASYSYPAGMTPARREQSAASHAALTQRLKKFGFTNYAAPSPSPLHRDDEPMPAESNTANTTAESTPLQTPTQDEDSGLRFGGRSGHDVNENVLVHDDEPGDEDEEARRLSWGLRGNLHMQDGYPATIVPSKPSLTVTDDEVKHDPFPTPKATANPMEIGKGRGRPTHEPELENTSSHMMLTMPGGLGIEMGTSPPFSSLAGMELRNGMFASRESAGFSSWGADGKTESGQTTPTPMQPDIVAPTPTRLVRTSSPTIIQGSPSSSPSLPERRKSHHHHHHHHHLPTFSIGRTSSSSSQSTSGSSSSGSDTANSERSTLTTTTTTPTTSRPKLVSPQPWPLPAQNQLRRVMSPPPPLGLGSRRIFEIKADDDDDDDEDEDGGVDHPPPSTAPLPAAPASAPPVAAPAPAAPVVPPVQAEISSPSSSDAVYQAFIRQWCFAQGPTPNLGPSSPKKSSSAERMGSPIPTMMASDVAVR